ncbi:diguanylate cyclase [Jannaschia sp. Os4]|uniref:LytS/YhcK type 5TM receptor domain-containing protein n=1 Tax=Jannaschia sp. Os4 TaxID=2807617 RepID=UPI001939E568|nr:LytS/YhcK type 5TM receptor domain-containing protein [Jannaschia sp. Os4]MBM2577451.1 diguanylate cyclase [Jannaschia sp. Os4]
MLTLNVAADFASSYALLMVLAWWTKPLRARLPDLAVGVLYGAVAALQMHLPIEMQSGVLIDMRAVSVALAGALLGPSGLAACLVIAVSTRWGLGGAGAPAGIGAIVIAGTMARIWAVTLSRRAIVPGPWAFLLLGAAMSLHLVSTLLLPRDAAWAFATSLAPLMLLMNLATVPPLAALGLRGSQAPLDRDAWLDAATGLLSGAGLRRAFRQRLSANLPSRGTGLTVLRLRHGTWVIRTFGHGTLDAAAGALRARLDAALPRDAMVARLGPTEVAVLWPDVDMATHRTTSMGLARQVGSEPVDLVGAHRLTVALESGSAWRQIDPDLDALLQEARQEARPQRARSGTGLPAAGRRAA